MKLLIVFITSLLTLNIHADGIDQYQPYLNTLEQSGQPPIDFVSSKLNQHQLVLFDDGNHLAKEPFDFYIKLIKHEGFQALKPTIFIELFDASKQPYVDRFLANSELDIELLIPVFKSEYTGFPLRFKTYLDLITTVYEANQGKPEEDRITVVAVSNPAMWSEIETTEDFVAFKRTLLSRDYSMYKIILSSLNNFTADKKGIFLTNTRHAYTGIKKKSGKYYWNTGTFFRQWHPASSYSIRFHSPQLFIERTKAEKNTTDVQGLSNIEYSWKRMSKGLWDSAFKANKAKSVAFELNGTPFGEGDYVGNHMLNAMPRQKMQDAFDGLIFLKPLEKLTRTAETTFAYQDNSKLEIKRRLTLVYGAVGLERMINDEGLETFDEYWDLLKVADDETSLISKDTLGPIDEWQF